MIFFWLFSVPILGSLVGTRALAIPPSCGASARIFEEYVSKLRKASEDEPNSQYSVLLPSEDQFLRPYQESLKDNMDVLRNKLLQNHVLKAPLEPGEHHLLSLSGLPITIKALDEGLTANGLTLKPCSTSKDSAVSFYTLNGFLSGGFQNFKLPSLTDEQLKILKEYGPKFHEHWMSHKDVLEDPSYEGKDLIILVPNDEEVDRVNKDQIVQLLASQVIVTPSSKNLMGEHVSKTTTSNGNIAIGGTSALDLHKEENITFYKGTSLVTGNAVYKNPSYNYDESEISSAFVPKPEDNIIKVLHQMQVHRFASLWKKVYIYSQTQYANAKENLCVLPKETGPCTQSIPMFYFDGETCRPFLFGGCDGNVNRFKTLRECTDSCINDPIKKKKIYKEICSLPHFQSSSTKVIKCDKRIQMFGFNKELGYCVPVSLGSNQTCVKSENIFKEHRTCADLCENDNENELYSAPPESPVCSSPETCELMSSTTDQVTKWAYDKGKGKCAPLKTKCKDPGLYNYELDCLKACKGNSNEVLTIFIPTDDAIRYLPRNIWESNFSGNLTKKYILPHFVRENPSVERPSVYAEDTFRIVLMHNIPKRIESMSQRSDEGGDSFVPFNGLPELKKEFFIKNKFAPYNEVYESIYRFLNTRKFSLVHKAISKSDEASSEELLNDHYAMARGFCLQSLSQGEPDKIFPQNVTRYFYNNQLGSCQSFQFSGIGGNANNFRSYSECSVFCGKFEGLVGEVEFAKDLNIRGKVLLVQPRVSQALYLEASFEGLKPNTLYMLEAGLTNLIDMNASSEGIVTINAHLEDHPELSSILNNKMILRELSTEDTRIVALGSIVQAPNVFEAKADIIHENNDLIRGEVTLKQDGPFAPVSISGYVDGIMEGQHGFHIHQIGSTSNGCKGAGPHFNPHGKSHGSPTSAHRHVGDLGNVKVFWGSNLQLDLMDEVISLYASVNSILGRTIVIHEKKDDLGLSGDFSSLTTGNAGRRVACGVVAKKAAEIQKVAKDYSKKSPGNDKGKIFFIPNDSVMNLVLEENKESLDVSESLREFAFCHFSNQRFDFTAKDMNYTTECGFKVNVVQKPSAGRGYEMSLNGVRAEKVIRDGRNTFFVLPFFLYADEEKIKKEATNTITSFRKSGYNELNSQGDDYRSRIELKQESPQVSLVLKVSLERMDDAESVHLRVMNSANIFPHCPKYQNDSVADLGNINYQNWNSKYTITTNNASLYGPDSILGGVIVLYDGARPLLCGIVNERKNPHPPHSSHSYRGGPWKDISLLRLPPQDPVLKSRARELGITLFFDAWDAALRNGIAFTSYEDKNITLVTMDDGNFQRLIPRATNGYAHPCNQDLAFQYHILEIMIIREKIEIEALQERKVIIQKSIGGYEFTFASGKDDTFKIDKYLPIRSEYTDYTNLYLMSRSLFMSASFLGPGDVFGPYDRSKFRVKHPNW